MSFNGWVKVHRKMLDHWVSQEPELFAFWMRLLIEANHSDKKRMFNGALVEIKRGQTLFGLDAFEAKSGISKKRLRRYLDMLETEGMIGRQKTNKYSLISICNYEQYQLEGRQEAGKGQSDGKPRASQGQHLENVKNGENVEEVDIVISYLNDAAGKKFRGAKTDRSNIAQRIEDYGMDAVKSVIDKKCAKWRDDPKMRDYLRPSTLFRPSNFDAYLNEDSDEQPKAQAKSEIDELKELFRGG